MTATATLQRDAQNRAWRTFLQGLAIDVAVAVAAVVMVVASDTEGWKGWAAVGVSLARSVAQAIASYVMRRFVDKSRIPTPLPPDPPGEPDDDRGAGEVRFVGLVALGIVAGVVLLYLLREVVTAVVAGS